MKSPQQKSSSVLAPVGTFMARLIRIVYIGTIKTEWQGVEKDTPKVWFTFELPTKKHVFKEGEEPKPFVISKEYTHSMGSKANLRPVTENILGTTLTDEEAKGFDHDELLGLPCQITIAHEVKGENTYSNISSIAPLLEGVECPKAVNDLKVLSYDKWDEKYFQSLPEFLKKKIVSSKEYKKMTGLGVEQEIKADDIPFD